MKPPYTFGYRNLLFGATPDDVWAVYRVQMSSYAGLGRADKQAVLSSLASFAYGIEADFTLLRVGRPWSLNAYTMGVQATTDLRRMRREELDAHLDAQRAALSERQSQVPEVYISVRLPRERAQLGSDLRSLRPVAAVRELFGLDDARGISRKRLEGLLDHEDKIFQRVFDYLDTERAASHEIEWLIRRAFCRGVADPEVDERFLPQALVVNGTPEDGGARFRPLEADVLRLMDAPLNVEPRSLRIEAEQGDSYQAFLCLGALPEVVPFPSRRAELLFAPLEALDFPVDAVFSARLVSNDQAVRLVRRRIVDADYTYREETYGEHGPSAASAERPRAARELEDYLTGGDRPPLLRTTISLAVGAPTRELLEDRIAQLRREYGVVKLHRPLGDQVRLFVAHLPGQACPIPDYDDYLTIEQFGAMVPTATHAVGAEVGPYIGYTLSGAKQAVLFDPTEASRTSRAPATLLSGTLGSGKTLCMELIMYQAFLAGSTICDIDPKGDHALERLPGVADEMEIIELSPDERYRGMLDPLRIAPEETREDLAYNFLVGILPEPVLPGWQTELRLAVRTVVARGDRSCGEVVKELEGGDEVARACARAIDIHASGGLARLGFATADSLSPHAGEKAVTSLRIRNLRLPLPGTQRAEMVEEERIGQAILHLLAVYALRLTSSDPRQHSVLGFDEAWVLLGDAAGRTLVDRISRLGRAQNVTPLLATQVLDDMDELEGLIGAAFCFGVETENEARKALRLLHLDDDDEGLQQRLMGFRRGRCLMRDYQGRVSPVQIDLVDDRLLATLDTTPRSDGNPDDAGFQGLQVVHGGA